jgi:hypothetical protein
MITVILSAYEMQMCELVGRARDASARKDNRNPGLGPGAIGPEGGHIRGAQCEYACSIGLNMFWRPYIGEIKRKDVGDIVQVRSTVLRRGRLLVKPKDDDDDPFVLVRQTGTLHELLGWLDARTCKASARLNGDHGDPVHYVDQGLLRNIHELKRRLHHGLALDEILMVSA